MDKKVLEFGELFNNGWNEMKKNFAFFIVIMLIAFSIEFIPNLFHENISNEASILIRLFFFIINSLIAVGLIVIYLNVLDGKQRSISDLFTHHSLLFNYIASHILYGLMVIVGLLFLVVPGIYLGTKYGLYSYFVVDKKMGPIEALKASAMATNGAKMQLFLFYIVVLLVNLLGLVCFGVGILITAPISMIALVAAYRSLCKQSNL